MRASPQLRSSRKARACRSANGIWTWSFSGIEGHATLQTLCLRLRPRGTGAVFWGSAQRPERCSEFLDENRRLLPGCEMAALGEPVVMDEIVVGALRPIPRSLVDLLRENADRGRNGDAQVVDEAALAFRVGPGLRPARGRPLGEG